MHTSIRIHALVASCLLSSLGLSCRPMPGDSAESDTTPVSRAQPEESRAERTLRKRAAHDLHCSESQLTLSDLGSGTRGVDGCGRRATYVLARSPNGFRTWVMNNALTEDGGGGGAAPAAQPASAGGDFKTAKGADGKTTLTLALPRIGTDVGWRFMARPAAYPDRVLLRFERQSMTKALESCSPRIVVDGGMVATLSSKYAHEKVFESQSIELPLSDLELIAKAQRVVADLCGNRLELSERDLAQVREFLVRFREEQAFAGTTPATPAEAAEPAAAGMGKL